jgi:uncharacterized protein YbbK (DUF523 family)
MAISRPRVGISRCLLGIEVRYDGGHKREPVLLELVGPRVEWVEVCPEVEVGMGVPREPVQLMPNPTRTLGAAGVRLVGATSGTDWTERMTAWARAKIDQLRGLELSGFVLKARSPSCGLRDVPVAGAAAGEAAGRGLFAQALVDALPDLPIEDEERLRNPAAREAFLERVFAYAARSRGRG